MTETLVLIEKKKLDSFEDPLIGLTVCKLNLLLNLVCLRKQLSRFSNELRSCWQKASKSNKPIYRRLLLQTEALYELSSYLYTNMVCLLKYENMLNRGMTSGK